MEGTVDVEGYAWRRREGDVEGPDSTAGDGEQVRRVRHGYPWERRRTGSPSGEYPEPGYPVLSVEILQLSADLLSACAQA